MAPAKLTAACTEQAFLKDVVEHQMIVLRDDGVNRHVRFGKPGTMNMHFDLITWPGYLCYTGDMGTYVFQRLEDMYEFFRTDHHYQHKEGRTLFINLGYWAEKLQSIDRNHGVKEYSAEKFRAIVEEWLDDSEASDEVRHAVNNEIFSRADREMHEAMRAAIEFEHDGFRFQDFWEIDPTEYIYHFVWCCYALSWGIQQYDQRRDASIG